MSHERRPSVLVEPELTSEEDAAVLGILATNLSDAPSDSPSSKAWVQARIAKKLYHA